MAGDTVITVVGNLTDDPELRFTSSGAAVANFTVASTPRFFDKNTNDWKDGDALFLRCSIWRQAAENVAETLTKGARVIVQGRLKQRSYETREGEKRTVYELDVDEVGPSLKYATAKVTKVTRGGAVVAASAVAAEVRSHPHLPLTRGRPRRQPTTSHPSEPPFGPHPHSPHPRSCGALNTQEHHDGQASASEAKEEGLPVL